HVSTYAYTATIRTLSSHLLPPLSFSPNPPATPQIYTLSLHDALPISAGARGGAPRLARARAARSHAAGAAPAPRRAPPPHARPRRDRRDLRRPRLLGRRGARGRDRLLQLRGAEHPARPSRARHAGHLLPLGVHAPPHPHVARPDPRDADAEAAGADHRPREGLSPRRRRHVALADVPPGRRARRGPRHHDGRPQGDARAVRAPDVR